VSAAEARIADAYFRACMDELEAPKPGNVHIYADGHGSTVADFRRSAEVSAGSIAKTEAAVGARILGAIEATHAAVGQNTNLGIVLLCAPLARAAELRAAAMAGGRLRDAVASVLNDLNVQDADLAFRAISLAAPGGLGRSERHDVGEPASATLLEAMIEAAARDRIARQYATGFADIFDLGSPCLETASRRWAHSKATATLCVYLGFLAAFPDTHIQRVHGLEAALDVQREAALLYAFSQRADDAAALRARALQFDASLKLRRLNPGASADLTVATLFAGRLDDLGAPDRLPA
jgi:triphosphoribosyl-dephospho-CoA synthase